MEFIYLAGIIIFSALGGYFTRCAQEEKRKNSTREIESGKNVDFKENLSHGLKEEQTQ